MKSYVTAVVLALTTITFAAPSFPPEITAEDEVSIVPIAKNAHNVESIDVKPPMPIKAFQIPNITINGFDYTGCRSDTRYGRTLTGKSMYLSNMTYAACSSFCAGSLYFGVEYYSECYCGNTLSNNTRSVGEPDCWMPCSGDSTTSCGGTDRISLFQSKNYVAPPPPPKPVDVAGYAYRGCYSDIVGTRTLNGSYFFDNLMTTTQCAGLCKNSTYFGTEYGGECYCSRTISSRAVELSLSQCDIPCKGDKTQACGGGNKLSVYWKLV